MYEFIKQFAPHLTQEIVQQSMLTTTKQDLDAIFAGIDLPDY